MMQPDARHIHPQQQTKNGCYYNDNYSIPNSSAIWKFRDGLWLYKYPMSVWQNASLRAFCHKGSNSCEFFHRNTEESFAYLPLEQVFLDRIPAITQLQKFAHNLKRAKFIVNKKEEEARKYDPDNFHIHEQILKKLDSICGMDCLRQQYMDTETGHTRLVFPNTYKTIDDFLYGFKWENSVSRTTKITYSDKEKIWQYLENYKDVLVQQNGKITDEKSLDFLQQKMQCKCTIAQLKNLIYKYWLVDDDLIDDAIDDLMQYGDDDHDGFVLEKYNTSPAPNKKNSE